jgi:alpha-galactosidase
MKEPRTTRRRFLSMSVGASAIAGSRFGMSQGAARTSPQPQPDSYLEVARNPNFVFAVTASKDTVPLLGSNNLWTYKDVVVEMTEKTNPSEMAIQLTAPKTLITYLHLRWRGRQHVDLRCIGDAWERSYGDLNWQGIVPERVMPWYFLTSDGHYVHGYGVKTQPSGMCFWQLDEEGVSLWIDLRSGGNAAILGSRTVQLATVVTHQGHAEEGVLVAGQQLCQKMCEAPRLPKSPIFGFNDWNYAYGTNTAEGIVRDADLLASVTRKGKHVPTLVIDDGWQDRKRFPSMAGLAAQIRQRGIEPGLWIRPLRAPIDAVGPAILSNHRFAPRSGRNDAAYDPTTTEGMEQALLTVRNAAEAGFTFIKHDFSTYDLLGRWGNEMGPAPTIDGWNFQDRSRTNAEIICDLYRAIRKEAGQKTVILGCNTIGHLAAGIFESQRIGDDTSGRAWERTRRMGVNSLSHRISQHRTLSYVDPDCVAFTSGISWANTKQWLDVVASTGTSLFISPAPDSINSETKEALRDAFAAVVEAKGGYPIDPLSSTVPQEWKLNDGAVRRYNWAGANGASPFPA